MALAEQMKAIVEAANDGAGGFEDAVSTVRQVAAELEANVQAAIGTNALSVKLLTGHKVNLGQQYRFAVVVEGVSDTFLRFYVPPEGFPTTLSLFEDETIACKDTADLEQKLVEFLGREPVKKRLGALMKMAKKNAPSAP